MTLRAEIDSHYLSLRTISANGAYSDSLVNVDRWMEQARVHPRTRLASTIKPSSTNTSPPRPALTRSDNAVGANYSINYDVLRSRLLQQRFTGFYNSQCCGLAFEYQVFNFSG